MHPAESKLQLVRTLRPGNIVAKLVVVRFVIPRSPVRRIVRARDSVQIDGRNALERVRSGEQAVELEARRGRDQSLRQDVNAVSVVVERDFIQQRRVDHMGQVNDGAVRGIPNVLPIVGTLSPLHIVLP